MNLKEYTKEELDNMSYDDLAYIILQESGKKMKLMDIFKKIAKLLNMSDADIENRIADFFEVMSTNKQFVMLDKGYWDLAKKHMKNVVVEDEIEESEDIIDDIEDETEEEKDIYYDTDEEDVDDDDELNDLVIIDEEEEASLE